MQTVDSPTVIVPNNKNINADLQESADNLEIETFDSKILDKAVPYSVFIARHKKY